MECGTEAARFGMRCGFVSIGPNRANSCATRMPETPSKTFHLLWREMQAVHELVAHAIQPNIGGVDLMKHKLVLVVHKVLCGALHVAEQLQKAG